jgi:hypothetical protein
MNRTRPRGERILVLTELRTNGYISVAEDCWLEAKSVLKVRRVMAPRLLAVEDATMLEEGWVGTVEGEVHLAEFTQLTIGLPLGRPISVDVAECAAFVRSLLGWEEDP